MYTRRFLISLALLGFLVVFPSLASADTVQEQIASILARIAALQTQISQLQLQGKTDYGSGNFKDGDEVKALVNLNVRLNPSTTRQAIGTVPAGLKGKIDCHCINGLIVYGYTWWYVRWENGVSGWSAEGTSEARFLERVDDDIVPGAPTITTSNLPSMALGQSYQASISATGGTGNYTWTITSGALPPGLSLDLLSCTATPCQVPVYITGTPTMAGNYAFTIQVTASGLSNTKKFTIGDGTLTPPSTITLISPNGGETFTVSADGSFNIPFSWSANHEVSNPSAYLYRSDGLDNSPPTAIVKLTGATSGQGVFTAPSRVNTSVPLPVGQYAVKICDSDKSLCDFSDGQFNVGKSLSTATLSPSKTQVAVGETITATWNVTGTTYEKDWIGVAPRGGNWSSNYSWFFTDGLSSGSKSITMPISASDYDLVYYVNNGITPLTRTGPVTVTNTVNPTTLNAFCGVSPRGVYTGEKATWSATASGGTGSYSYYWYGDNIAGATTQSVDTTFNTAGLKTAYVIVTSGAQSVTRNCATALVVTTPPVANPPQYVSLGLSHPNSYDYSASAMFDTEENKWKVWWCGTSDSNISGWNQRGDAIFYAESSDKINWTAPREVLRALGKGTQEDLHTCDPSVLKDPGYPVNDWGGRGYRYMMYYMTDSGHDGNSGYYAESHVNIAVSKDGINWDRATWWNPVLTCKADAAHIYGCGQFDVIRRANDYVIIFSADTSAYASNAAPEDTNFTGRGQPFAGVRYWRSWDGLHPIEDKQWCLPHGCWANPGVDFMYDPNGSYPFYLAYGDGVHGNLYGATELGGGMTLLKTFNGPGNDPMSGSFFRLQNGFKPAGPIWSMAAYPADPTANFNTQELEGINWNFP